MITSLLYELTVLSVFVFIGGIVYLIDDLLGTSIMAGWHKLTTKEGLPIGTKLGFIGGRSTQTRVIEAIVLGSLAFYELHAFFATTFLGNLLVLLVAIIGVFVGFVAGPLFVRVWNKRGKAIKAIETVEKGEFHPVEEARQAITELAHNASEKVGGLGHNLSGNFFEAIDEAARHLPGAPHPSAEVESPVTTEVSVPEVETETAAEVAVESPSESPADKARRELDEFVEGTNPTK